jgi:hypothetical protein
MKLDDLHTLWAIDQEIDFSQPDKVIRDIPILHAKWWRIYTDERQRYLSYKQEFDTLRHAKFEWYLGRMSDQECKARGWSQQPLRLVRQEVDTYLANDTDLIPLNVKVELISTKLKFVEDVIKHINGRGYLVKSYIDWFRFSNGS